MNALETGCATKLEKTEDTQVLGEDVISEEMPIGHLSMTEIRELGGCFS